MNKQDLVAHVAEKAGLSKVDASKAIEALLAGISESISRQESVALAGFGTFSVKQRNARTGRNPQTGEAVDIPAKSVATFKPGKTMRESLID